MPTNIEIINSALSLLKKEPISSIGEDTDAGEWAETNFYRVRDALLGAYPWSFCRARASLAALVDAPEWGYTYQYALPEKCLRVWKVDGEDEGTAYPWTVEGVNILTDNPAPFLIRYIVKEENPGKWKPYFVEALVAALAATGAYRFTGSVARETTLKDDAQRLFVEACMNDARENSGNPEKITNSTWVESRY